MAMNQGLKLKPSNPVYKLITSLPNFADNPVGKVARKAFSNKFQGALSGYAMDTDEDPSFRNLFFPSYSPVKYEDTIDKMYIVDPKFYADFSAAILSQSIYQQTTNAKKIVNIDKVDADISYFNNQMNLLDPTYWYAYVLLSELEFHGSHYEASRTYMDQLDSDHWITFKMQQFINGTWLNQEWELFHHWAKLYSLGVYYDEIDWFIGKLRNRGLNIPDTVSEGKWRSYRVWLDPEIFDHRDFDEAAKNGELENIWGPPMKGSTVFIKAVRQPEGNSIDFMRNTGGKYYVTPPSSCLSSGTLVQMADETSKPISEIKAGDIVKTSSGSSKVLLVSSPKTGTRNVYSINGLNFYFTDAHPFLTYSKVPRYAAVSPLKLLKQVPLLNQDGIAPLQVGTELLGSDGSKITVSSLDLTEWNETYVYDLIIEPSADGKFEYFAGADGTMLTVASELSSITTYSRAEELAFLAITNIIGRTAESLQKLYSASGHDTFLARMWQMALDLKRYFLYEALQCDSTEEGTSKYVDLPLAELIPLATQMCQDKGGVYDQACGAAYDYFMQILFNPVASSIELGHRVVPRSNSLEYLVIAVMDFGVIDTAPKIPSTPTIFVRVPGQEPQIETGEENEEQLYARKFYKSFFFLIKPSDKSFNVTLQLHDPSAEQAVILEASLLIQPSLNHGCVHWCLPFFDKERVEQGYINVDARILPSEQLEIEENQEEDWNDQSQVNLAANIEEVCVESLFYRCAQFKNTQQRSSTHSVVLVKSS